MTLANRLGRSSVSDRKTPHHRVSVRVAGLTCRLDAGVHERRVEHSDGDVLHLVRVVREQRMFERDAREAPEGAARVVWIVGVDSASAAAVRTASAPTQPGSED